MLRIGSHGTDSLIIYVGFDSSDRNEHKRIKDLKDMAELEITKYVKCK
jgi:hypothetical protein